MQPANYNQFPFSRSATARKKRKMPRSAETTEETTTSRNEAREKKERRRSDQHHRPRSQIPFFLFVFLFFSGAFLGAHISCSVGRAPSLSLSRSHHRRHTNPPRAMYPFIFDAPFCSRRHIGLSYCFLASLPFLVFRPHVNLPNRRTSHSDVFSRSLGPRVVSPSISSRFLFLPDIHYSF